MGMTRKHYEMVADNFAESMSNYHQSFIAMGVVAYQRQEEAVRTVAMQMSLMFKFENPKFDAVRFEDRIKGRFDRLNRMADLGRMLARYSNSGLNETNDSTCAQLRNDYQHLLSVDQENMRSWRTW